MKSNFLLIAFVIFFYSCNESSGKETRKDDPPSNLVLTQEAKQTHPLRVGREEVMDMRNRRFKDTSVVKISMKDIQSIMSGSPASNDSLIFYFVKYDSKDDRARYELKVPNSNWNKVRGSSSVLVGFINGSSNTGHLAKNRYRANVQLYDFGVVCPPPPSCDCEIAQ